MEQHIIESFSPAKINDPITDSDGKLVKAGMFVRTSYGIPPIKLRGEVVRQNGRLWVLTPGHKPERCSLVKFKEYLGEFWID